jgi:hypothetical protein
VHSHSSTETWFWYFTSTQITPTKSISSAASFSFGSVLSQAPTVTKSRPPRCPRSPKSFENYWRFYSKLILIYKFSTAIQKKNPSTRTKMPYPLNAPQARRLILTTILSLGTLFADDLKLQTPAPPDSIQESLSAATPPLILPPKSISLADSGLNLRGPVGEYAQPLWTSQRLFSEVRTYVIPAGQFEFEYWLMLSLPSSKEKDEAKKANLVAPQHQVKQVYEAEMGLGHRLQLDLYMVFVKDGYDGHNVLDGTKFEVRYAFANWDKLWGNPTVYLEWEQAAEGDDALEGKLLLCGEFNRRVRWATNLVWEEKTGGTRERGLEWNSALSYAPRNEKLSMGFELNIADISELETADSEDRNHHQELAAGPSLRFYPAEKVHVILTEMVGLNENAHQSKTVGIVGWEF